MVKEPDQFRIEYYLDENATAFKLEYKRNFQLIQFIEYETKHEDKFEDHKTYSKYGRKLIIAQKRKCQNH